MYTTHLGFTGVNKQPDCRVALGTFFSPVLGIDERPDPKWSTVRTLLRPGGRRFPGAVEIELTLLHNDGDGSVISSKL